ncbi:hypothetical protein PN441_16660 [Spirulina major CS-329]|uniref:type IIL restriction-modification enzyme MmeI n=1 Tax=Spirulina TaxID=1154 RepID=UPI002330325E|nr:type IIL restriction-modification enzyme MmeI [Spirulina major]MDB9504712.1 hypothetical protein [Spirulina major CS-329]
MIPLPPSVPILLDGRPVEKITAFLFPKGGNDDPKPLQANAGKSFIGSYVLGMGFTFDDTNPDATPIAEMHRLIEQNPKNAEVIFSYIGGSEVNSSPTHAHHRYVINFGEMTEVEAREWPDLIAIVEKKVKPKRLTQGSTVNPDRWWMFARPASDLQQAIAGRDRVLFHPNVSQNLGFVFLESNMVFAAPHNIFVLKEYTDFAVLQSRIHEDWARFLGSSMKDDLRYTPSDCFETFPFPEDYETNSELENIGKTYYEYRADLMIRNNQGLTDTYNRFHDPDERDPEILKLRDLHDQMDRAVLNAYGWPDLDPVSGFALDYLDTDPDQTLPSTVQDRITSGDLFFATPAEAAAFDSLARTGKRKLPWRYRWPEITHDEVLARLLELNHQRHEAELLAGKSSKTTAKKTPQTKKNTKKTMSKQLNYLDPSAPEN